jgi:hypothetical protein
VTAASRKTDPIRKITTKNGETRYRFIIDVGKRPDGKRDQRCYTFRTMKEARAERSKIIADRSRGTLVKRTSVTLTSYARDGWLLNMTCERSPGSGTPTISRWPEPS